MIKKAHDRRLDVLKIVQRLTHAHKYNVPERFGPELGRSEHTVRHLLQNLTSREVAEDAHGAGSAELAPHLAADLTGHVKNQVILQYKVLKL